MDAKELETYQVQLSHVELALESDPDNAELSSLATELKELIALTQASLATSSSTSTEPNGGASATTAVSNNPSGGGGSKKHYQNALPGKTWSAGDECLAKYSGDGQWYPARITSVGGAESHRVFSVVFRGYNTTELLQSSELKSLPPSYRDSAHSTPPPNSAASSKRKISKEDEEEREKKKKKNEKKLEVRAAKASEQNAKQASWQKFAKKSEKKGVHIAGVAGSSIFKTPDNPLGKVGVTGSGKGMTENAPRPKNKFSKTDED